MACKVALWNLKSDMATKVNALEIIRDKIPFLELGIIDGVICDVFNGKARSTLMNVGQIEITKKIGFNEITHGRVEYQFALSGSTDAVWRAFFFEVLNLEDVVCKIHGSQIDIQSSPDEIQKYLEAAKSAARTANAEYTVALREVRELALKKDAERQEEQRREEARLLEIKRSFDSLEL